MRITVVSAHYPPNFVSGGTLQPQRLARGLRGRGHDVRVFAGLLDSERTPLEVREDVDHTGLPVHWVVSTPFMGWSDRLNYDNPGVAQRFAEHLAAHPADVVHLHSLQTLGAGLVGVAKASGAITVVTMHDFWWLCARQFLVDRDDRPCSLVVAAGACECEAGRPSLEARTTRLVDLLAPADLVLAPSRSAADVLAANGVAAGRLAVDENGMEVGAVTARRPRAPGAPIVVRYTGGSNAMKGAEVLLDAVHQLGPQPGLRLIAHDLEDAVDRDGRPILDTVLEVVPPYEPDQLDEVLAGSDLLVVPSVMRETHSLVTREALLRHVPVITTDTLGPEEVVDDDVNGLIVPAGDVGLLADALTRVLDPGSLARWQAGASRPLEVQSTASQVEGLERRFADLLTPSEAAPRPSPISRVLFVVGIDGAPLRYRAQLPAEALGLLGVDSDIRHYRDPDVAELAAAAEVVVVYRVPATPQVLQLIEQTRSSGTPVVFDVDDLIFDPSIAEEIPALRLLPGPEAALWLEGVQRYRTTMEACDAYIGSTARLVAHARASVGIDAHLFENGVGCALGAASEVATARARRPGPTRIGYFSGTTTHDDDWRHVEEAVLDALVRHPDVELWLGGHLQTSSALDRVGDRVRHLPFVPWNELPETLRDLDVNLAPLEPGSRFNDAKSAIKWLEAALVATPTIASPSAPFQDAIQAGRTGWLADTPGEWTVALDQAIGDAAGRRAIGERARRSALLRWSPHLQAQRYLAILDQVHRAPGPRRTPSPRWTPVVRDEPWLVQPTQLVAYPPSTAVVVPTTPLPGPPTVAQRVREKASLVRERLREEGLVATMQATARWVRRRLTRRRDAA